LSDTAVLDASALLALLQAEPGADAVAPVLGHSAISAVNLSEVVAKLTDAGMPREAVRNALGELPIDVHPFDQEDGYTAGELRTVTRKASLSLGDRACLALATRLEAVAVTADRSWGSLPEGTARIAVIR
jgi:ribonuclease VapC